jgi:hypothetical protein
VPDGVSVVVGHVVRQGANDIVGSVSSDYFLPQFVILGAETDSFVIVRHDSILRDRRSTGIAVT